jgi:tetratricopeptide (TPR) repeat protein
MVRGAGRGAAPPIRHVSLDVAARAVDKLVIAEGKEPMMSRSAAFATVLLLIATASHPRLVAGCETCGGKSKPAVLIPGLGKHHHPVSTRSALAQRFFDQGLTLLFGFNHDEAVRSFKRAAELDPQLAMAHWGIALCLGPNYNMPAEPAMVKAAHEAAQKALTLAVTATERERAYIEAVTQRYAVDPKADPQKLALDYKKAMGSVATRWPDDLDAATLYAESAMNLRPWALYSLDGTPAEGTEEIVAVLESVLKRNPDHPGANHYYIHAVEASRYPERAIPSALRLASLAPAAGHLVHMPAHIWLRVGEYAAAARSNAAAAAVDRSYIKRSGVKGVYPQLYYSHNLHFLAVAHAMQGRSADATKAADQLVGHVRPHVQQVPMLEMFMPTSTLILVRFGRWDEILSSPAPEPAMKVTRALWHFARGLAYTAKGNPEKAETARSAFRATAAAVPDDVLWGNSSARTVLEVAGTMLDARMALAREDAKTAIALLRKAVAAEDRLRYNEPPDWYLPAREALGAALLVNREGEEAERVFRAELKKNPRSGRSLLGLRESLKAQGKTDAARFVQRELDVAWKNADTVLSMGSLFSLPAAGPGRVPTASARKAARR